MSSLPATWYDGKGSRPRAVVLDCPSPGTLRVVADEVVMEFAAAGLELSPRLGRMPRTLRLPGEGLTPDRDAFVLTKHADISRVVKDWTRFPLITPSYRLRCQSWGRRCPATWGRPS